MFLGVKGLLDVTAPARPGADRGLATSGRGRGAGGVWWPGRCRFHVMQGAGNGLLTIKGTLPRAVGVTSSFVQNRMLSQKAKHNRVFHIGGYADDRSVPHQFWRSRCETLFQNSIERQFGHARALPYSFVN